MSSVTLTGPEEEALYVALKSRQERYRASPSVTAGMSLEPVAPDPLTGLLRRLERALFERLTIEELEQLPRRYPEAR